MKRIIASIGLCLFAAQVALGSADALFLCLCFDHDDGEVACAPAAETEHCTHSDAELIAPAQPDCSDLLLTCEGENLIERSSSQPKLKPPSYDLLPALISLVETTRNLPTIARAPQECPTPPPLTPDFHDRSVVSLT